MERIGWEDMVPLWIFGSFGFAVLLGPVLFVHEMVGQRIASAWVRMGLN